MVTMQDIAARAGVAKSTVSHVLNGRETAMRISEDTRKRVMQMADEMGYRRNGSALAMSSGRFNCAALLTSTHTLRSYVPQDLMSGIHDALGSHGMQLNVSMLSDDKLTDSEFMPQILREWLVDGLLIDYIVDIPQRLVQMIERHQIPAVWINNKCSSDGVFPNDQEAGRLATEHLILQGHRNIIYVDYSHGRQLELMHYSARDREAGYREAMEAAGLMAVVKREENPVPVKDRMALTQSWLSAPDRPTAVLAYYYEYIMLAAMTMGLRVPQDLSLLSFGPPAMNFVGIPITGLIEPNFAVGTKAVSMLLEKLKNPGRALPSESVSFGFQEGMTCAPPK